MGLFNFIAVELDDKAGDEITAEETNFTATGIVVRHGSRGGRLPRMPVSRRHRWRSLLINYMIKFLCLGEGGTERRFYPGQQ